MKKIESTGFTLLKKVLQERIGFLLVLIVILLQSCSFGQIQGNTAESAVYELMPVVQKEMVPAILADTLPVHEKQSKSSESAVIETE